MATAISCVGPNSGIQVGLNKGNITAQFLQSEASLNQACLRDLRTTDPHDDKDRIQYTNGGLFIDSYRWILDNEQFKQWQGNQGSVLLWIRGDPGKGKTMLLCGIIDELIRLTGDSANVSFFFCQATDVRINNATAVLRGLIYSLVQQQSSLLSHVRSRYDEAGKSLFEDINAWSALSKIFAEILRDPALKNTVIVIDALDECMIGLPFLLDLVVRESSTHSHVKWIVSSRNWPDIEERLSNARQVAPISLEPNETAVGDAVRKFILHKVHCLADAKKYDENLRDTVYRHLSANSQDTFLWVALVCQELHRTPRRHVMRKLKDFPPGLDTCYDRMIHQVHSSEDAELCKRILAVMSLVYRPITLEEFAALVEIPCDFPDDLEELEQIIRICGSFLTLRKGVILFIHQSAKEFPLDKAQIEVFPAGIQAEHLAIFSLSLQTLFKTLCRNILDIQPLAISTKKSTQQSLNPLAAANYACLYWVDHLYEGWAGDQTDHLFDNGGYVDKFLRQHFLHWLECLGILGSIPLGIMAMLKLENLLHRRGKSTDLRDRVHDASRFIRYFRHAIESSPLQVYSSGLIFSPTQSITKRCYQKEKPSWILNCPEIDENWSSCLQTLEGHCDDVNSIAWSPDGSRLASASSDQTIRIWDPLTGQTVSTLEGHGVAVNLIAWSPDGSRLASASFDKTIRIWDPVCGQSASTLGGHSGQVHLIAWSPDGSRLASASFDKTIRIWDPITGPSLSTLKHSGPVLSIAWSSDGCRLASASFDKIIRIWDPVSGQSMSDLKGHSGKVHLITWSPDGSRLASASSDQTIRIWDPLTGQTVTTIEGHGVAVNLIAWSPDGSRVVSASADKIIRIWDPVTGQSTATLEGHQDTIDSVASSPDGSLLASTSFDETIKIWDCASGQCSSTLVGNRASGMSIAWSPDSSRLASASRDKTVKIWDPTTGQSASTLDGDFGVIGRAKLIAWSPDGSQLASASFDKTVRIWDPASGQCLSILEGHDECVDSLAWSPDGNQLASASFDKTVRIWDPATTQCAITFDIYSPSFLQFDRATPNHLHTNGGTLHLGSTEPVAPSTGHLTLLGIHGYSLSNDLSWVTYNGSKLLWLPAEYRPSNPYYFVVSATTVAIVCSSDRVIFLDFSETIPV